MDGCSAAHGETPLLCGKGDSAAPESQGDLPGPEEAHASRGGVALRLYTIRNTCTDTQIKLSCEHV